MDLKVGCVSALLVFGCAAPAKPVAPPANTAPNGLTITASAIGPVDAKTPATLAGLRTRLAGYDVRPVNDTTLVFDVYQDGEKLFYVVPGDDGSVFNVQAVSAKVSVAGHAWKVGAPFPEEPALVTSGFNCECWGEKPICYKKADHVAAVFERTCEGLTGDDNARNRQVLVGLPIQRMVWSPKAFGVEADDKTPNDPWAPKEPTGNPCGGGSRNPCGGGGDPCGGGD